VFVIAIHFHTGLILLGKSWMLHIVKLLAGLHSGKFQLACKYWKRLAVANTLAYFDKAKIMAVKSFMVEPQDILVNFFTIFY
jgi:hypothetical protein